MTERYRYTNVKVNLSDNQKDKIRAALNNNKSVAIQLKHGDLNGDDILPLTQGQLNNLAKAYENKTGVRIIMSKTQVEHNKTIEGGILGAILGAVASAALPSVVSWIYDKITGKGLFVKRGGRIVNVRQLGDGLYLKPYSSDKMTTYGDGLYIKTGGGFEAVTDAGNLKDHDLLRLIFQ